MSDAQDGEQQGDDVEHDDIEREQDVDKTLILDLLYKPEWMNSGKSTRLPHKNFNIDWYKQQEYVSSFFWL